MIILVANLGSTSFKYKLYDMPDARVLAEGGADRIGAGESSWSVQVDEASEQGVRELPDHASAIDWHLAKLQALGAVASLDAIEAVGFKAVHGGPISGAVVVDDEVISTMETLVPLAPAHNPPYLAAFAGFKQSLPHAAQVASFETGFHTTIPKARQVYGVPYDWIETYGIRRYGFHGASNAYIAQRMAEVAPTCKRIINLHLGGSCSVCAIQDGKSVAHSMGATPQTGVFHAGRVGDLDAFAVPALRAQGMSDDAIFQGLGKQSGLLGLSGVSSDMRDIRAAAKQGNAQAQLAIDAFVESCRHHLGASLVALGGVDAVVFTAGIGQYEPSIREAICEGLAFAGIELDQTKNNDATGKADARVDAGSADSAQVWVMPTNEELIVARQALDVLTQITSETTPQSA